MIPTPFDPLELARLSALAYEDLPTVIAARPMANVTLLDRNDSQAYVLRFPEYTVVAFRGTQVTDNFSMTDVIRNTKVTPVRWHPGLRLEGGHVHEGYKEGVDAIKSDLIKAVTRSKPPLIYTGHSLGGSMATLARTLSPKPYMTMTFGAPKVGDREFVNAYQDISLVRYSHASDIAPKYAPPWLGYRHGGSFVHLTRSGRRRVRPWLWTDELIIPVLSGLAIGTLDHRIGEYIAKLKGAEL